MDIHFGTYQSGETPGVSVTIKDVPLRDSRDFNRAQDIQKAAWESFDEGLEEHTARASTELEKALLLLKNKIRIVETTLDPQSTATYEIG